MSAHGDVAPCLFCNGPEHAEILEIWSPREFTMDTCCEGMHHAVNEFLAEDGKAAADWLRNKGLDALVGHRSRRVIDDDGHLVLDFKLEIGEVDFATAKNFVTAHHRHCKAPRGWRFGAGIKNGSELIGVVMVGRPVARMIDASRVIEVNRLCIRTDIAADLAWNACSQLYGWAAREAKKRGFEKVITYTRQDEPGTTLKAAGWTVEHTTKGRHWDAPGRPREKQGEAIGKFRWTPAGMVAVTTGLPQLRPITSQPCKHSISRQGDS